MKGTATLFLTLACISFVYCFVAPDLVGTYVQCNFETHDKSVLVVYNNLDYYSRLQYIAGGCSENGDIDYELVAHLNLDFYHQNSDKSFNIRELYSRAMVVPRNSRALLALELSCPNNTFVLGEQTDVLDCFFCGADKPQYDLLYVLPEGGFLLSDGLYCDTEPKAPEDLDMYPFVPVNPYYYGGVSTIEEEISIITFDYATVSAASEPSYRVDNTTDRTPTTYTLSIQVVYKDRSYYTLPHEYENSASLITSSLFIIALCFFFL